MMFAYESHNVVTSLVSVLAENCGKSSIFGAKSLNWPGLVKMGQYDPNKSTMT